MMKPNSVFWIRLALVALMLSVPSFAYAQAQRDDATYQAIAQKGYEEGMEALEDGEYLDASRKFNAVRARFPYSQYATLSELRLGDVYFGQEKFASAIEQYRGFAKLHPNHKQVVYASYRVALSFFKQMPEDWFFMPPAYEKDLAKTEDAARELRFFIARHAKSPYTKEAKTYLAQVRRLLADHEFYVADFYLRNDNPRAAAMRLTYLLDKYAGLGLDARSLFLLGRSYLELGDTKKAKAAFEDLIEFHGKDSLAATAKEYLNEHKL